MYANRRMSGRSVSAAMLIWKWWPGTASWNATTSDRVRLRSVAPNGFTQ